MTGDVLPQPRLPNEAPVWLHYRWHWLSISFLVSLLLVLAALRPLALPDEGRYGEIGRWMLESGDWTVPRINGIPFFHKTPLLYWLEASSIWLFGPHAWSVRLVVSLHAALMLAVTYLALRRITNPHLAHIASWMLGSSLSFLVGGQYVNHDMLVAAWISVAIWCFSLALMNDTKPNRWLARAGFAACAMGVLAKGLIGLVIPAAVLLIWLVATRRFSKICQLPWGSGLLIFSAIALPWFVLAGLEFDGMLQYMFIKQHLQRYTSSTFNNVRPFWFYGVALALLFFPWIGFVLYQAAVSIRQAAAQLPVMRRQNVALCWVWLGTVFVFFSIPSSKIVGYMLPVMPALAALGALGWQAAMSRYKNQARWFGLLCAISLTIAVAGNTAAARYTLKDSSRDAALQFICLAGPGATVYAVGDFPYDFPFYARMARPMVVVQDWSAARKQGADNWLAELYEGAEFDLTAKAMLQMPDALILAATKANHWVVAPNHVSVDGFELVFRGQAWSLHRSSGTAAPVSAPKSPVAAEHKSQPRCDQQGN